MHKKGQGISMTVIIVAALALLVLVVLSIIFLGKMGETANVISSCTDKGGYCVDECSAAGIEEAGGPVGAMTRSTGDTCPNPDEEVCCIAIGGAND